MLTRIELLQRHCRPLASHAVNTHSVGGISENDFICAAKADAAQQSGGS
jgi:hypothetical protein